VLHWMLIEDAVMVSDSIGACDDIDGCCLLRSLANACSTHCSEFEGS